MDKYFLKKSKRSTRFGNSFESFYKGTKNTFLTPKIQECLNVVYGNEDSSYTSKSYPPDTITKFGKIDEHRYLLSILKKY